MKKSTLLAITLAAVAALAAGSSSARAALHIKFDGIDGESNDVIHKDWCDALSFSHGFSKPQDASGAVWRRGDAIVDDLVFTKELDKASPKIAEGLLKGRVYPKVEIHLTGTFGGARKTYLAYELKNVWITSYAISGSGNSDSVPMEEISLSFEEIKMSYSVLDQGGNLEEIIEFSWKIEEEAGG